MGNYPKEKLMYRSIVGLLVLPIVWFFMIYGPVTHPALAQTGKTADSGTPLAKLDIKAPTIPSTRGVPKGTLTVAQHFGLSPKWLDPQEQGVGAIAQAFAALVHDAMIKPTGQGYYTYSLAENLEMPVDYTYAKFRLRQGLTFHDGTPLTTADVKWTYENYRGFHAATLHDKLDKSRPDGGIEIIDERNMTFHFKEPFIDFLEFYNGIPTGIGWILPKDYYQKVGPDKFKEHPIGAGPFKFVRQEVGSLVEVEAWDGYWRRPPGVKHLVVKHVQGFAQRLAALQTGEVDLAYGLTGKILKQVIADKNLRWDSNFTNPWHFFFPGYDDPGSPFHDKRVRQAISLAINREFLSQQESEGIGPVWGNWIGPNRIDAIEDLPQPEYDPEKAQKLLSEAGYANGLKLKGIAPFPPYYEMAERLATDLKTVGITVPVDVMDQPAFRSKMAQGKKGWPGGKTIVHEIAVAPGSAAAEVGTVATCDSPAAFICEPYIEERWAKHQASVDPAERKTLIQEIQRYVIEEYLAVPIYINPFVHAVGPNVLPEDDSFHKYWAAPQSGFPWPWEDWEVKK
jgi:peptide/nickel transport system substrate-binding protein